MDLTTGSKAKGWRFWAQLLTIRQIAGHNGLWRTVTGLTGEDSDGGARLSSSAAIRMILAGDEPIPNPKSEPTLNGAPDWGGGRVRIDYGTHPQWPDRPGRQVVFRGARGPAHPGDRRCTR